MCRHRLIGCTSRLRHCARDEGDDRNLAGIKKKKKKTKQKEAVLFSFLPQLIRLRLDRIESEEMAEWLFT